MRTLNVPLLLVIVFVVAAAATGTYFVHEWQVHRNAQFLLTLADRFEASDQIGQAVGSLGRYVALEPDDTDALARLGLLHARRRNDAQAYVSLEQVLRRQPVRDDVRRELVDVAMRIGRYSDARDHLEQHLLRADRNNAPLLNLLGTCQEKLGDSAAAVKQFELAITAKPDYLESYIALARLYTRMKEPDRADKVLQALVENNPGSENGYRAYLLRGAFRLEQMAAPMSQFDRDSLLSLAEDDAREALLFDVDKSEALLLAAKLGRLRAQAKGDQQPSRDLAREYIAQGLALFDGRQAENDALLPGFYRLLASLELDDGRRDLAIEALRRGVTQVEQRGEKANLRWSLAEALIDDDQLPEAQTVIDALRTEEVFAPFVAYLDARIKFANGDWQSGAGELERLRPRLAEVPDLAKQVDFWLGRGYGMLNREDLELAAYRRAIEADDHWVAPHCMLAAALAKAGRTHDAAEHYRRAMQLPGCPPEAYLALARLRAAENLRQPPARQDWKELESLLNTAAQRLPESAEIAVLQAQAEVARGDWTAGRQRLAQAAQNHRTDLAVWTASIALERLTGNLQQAEKLLASAQANLGDHVELRLERAALLVSGDGAAPALVELARGAAAFSADEQARLRIGLARHLQSVGAFSEAKKMVLQVIDDAPQDLTANLVLFDMAVAENDESGLVKWLRGIENCQDPDAPVLLLYGDAVRLVLAVERSTDRTAKADRARLQKASDELTEARGQRPSWPRLALLQARIEELRDKPARAIPWLQQAVDLGAGDEIAIRLIVLLARQKDYEQAERLLLRLDEKQAALTPEVAPWAFDALSHRNDYGKALELAHKACVASANWRDHIWFGRIAAEVVLSGKLRSTDEKQHWLTAAEQEIGRAIELDADEIEAWFGLLNFYARTQRSSELETSIDRAEQRLPEHRFHLLLARYHQSIDDLATARKQLELALSNSPDDATTLRYAAEFYIQRQELPKAREVLEHLLEPQVSAESQDHDFARRSLAVVYLTDRSYRSFLKGIELAKGENPELPANRRALAILLGRSPVGADRRQAIELFKQLAAQSLLEDTDRYLLAELCWLDRRRPEAMEVMEGLLEKSANNSTFIAGYAQMLLDENRPDDAERWIKRLEGLEPQAVRTVELRARAWACRHRENKAVSVLENRLASQASGAGPAFDRGQLAILLENLGTWKPAHDAPRPDEFFTAAERHFRQAAAESPPNSQPYAALAGFLGRHGKVKEALRLYDDLWQHDQLDAAAIGYAELTAQRKLAPPQLAAVEKQVEAVLPEHSESIVLLSALARIYRAQGKFDDLDATYRKIIKINPDSVIALNNLSVLLTLRGRGREEAGQLIERAVELGGPTPALLDSRAMVKLAAGEAESAIDDLKQATADEASPDFYFHLAQAEILRHDGAAAAQALGQARSLGLDEQSLHPLERDAYQRLVALVPQPSAEPELSLEK